jgi:hypothetical protein
VTDAAAALPLPGRVPRAHGHPPPLKVWIATAALFALVVAAIAVAFEVATPMPTAADMRFFNRQVASLEKQEQMYRARGEDPISVVFLGTSRMKNVTMDPASVAEQAKAAGIERPVASTYFAVDWGGFERLSPEVRQIEQLRPDVVVMMPEFFTQDFNWRARLRFGMHYLQATLWGKEFLFFGYVEYDRSGCIPFKVSASERLDYNDEWIRSGTDLKGPRLAREAVKRLGDAGTLVLVADVPPTPVLNAAHAATAGPASAAHLGLPASPQVRTAWIGHSFAPDDYCDVAHIKPSHASRWQRAFFDRSAADLNGLR